MAHTSKSFGIILTALLFFTLSVQAQKRDSLWLKTGRWSAWGVRFQTQTFGVSENNLDTCNCDTDNRSITQRGNAGMLVSYYRSVSTRLAYSVDLGVSYGRVSTTKRSTLVSSSELFTSLRGDLYYHVGKERQMISPYVHTGIHAQIGSLYASLPLGAGMRWMMKNSPIFITTQLDYGLGLTSNLRNNLITSLGVYINLGADKKQTVNRRPGRYEEQKATCDVDTDMDGIPDMLDACPRLKGSKDNMGCPVCDTDGDGIVDDKDKCPTIPGSMANQGCPILDSDGDGVIDEKDNCPTQPGPISNVGCPIIDRDGDGVADLVDRCPDVAGHSYNNGCPANASGTYMNSGNGSNNSMNNSANDSVNNFGRNYQQGLKTILGDTVKYIIYFDFDKYDLTANSFDILNDAIDYLKKNDEYKVLLVGHTDLEGNSAYNIKLSQNRVKTTRTYLNSYGIEDARITSSFYGKTKPAIPSFDKGLAWKNRRVEIYLSK